MGRLSLSLCFLVVIAGGLFAGGMQGARGDFPTTEDGKVKVVFWTHSRHDLAFRTDQVDRFNATNKDNVFVVMESHTESITDELNLAFESEQAPTIFSGRVPTNTYYTLGRFADLRPLLKQSVLDRYAPWLKEGKNMRPGPDGEYILGTIPSGFGTTFRFIWNKDLFKAAGLDPQKPPKTYDELVAFAKQITEYGSTQNPKKYGFAWPGVEYDVWEYWVFNPGTDSGLYTFDYDKLKYNYSQYKPILAAYSRMREDGSLFPGVLQLSYDPPRAQFAEGNIGMYFAADWDVGVLTEQFPAKIQWGVAPNPTLTGTKTSKTIIGGGYGSLYINGLAHLESQRAAARFLEFICSLEEQAKYYEGGYGTPTMAEIAAAAATPKDVHVKGFAAVDDALYPRWPPEIELEGENYKDVFDAIIFGRVDIDKALADLDKRTNEALDKAFESGDYAREDYRIAGWSPPKSDLK